MSEEGDPRVSHTEEMEADVPISVDELVGMARSGDIEGLRSALAQGVSVHGQATELPGMNCLMAAARFGQLDTVRFLLQESPQRPGISAKSVGGDTALHYAAMSGDVRVVKLLAEEGAGVNEPGDLGNTPLHLAAAFGQTDAAKVLVSVGASLSARNEYGNAPLALATDVECRAALKRAAASPADREDVCAEAEDALWEAYSAASRAAEPAVPRAASLRYQPSQRTMEASKQVLAAMEAARARREDEDDEEDRVDAEAERVRREEEERLRREEEERLRAEEEERLRLEAEAAAKKKKKKGKGKKGKK